MGGKKRRHTAKTGDKNLYNIKSQIVERDNNNTTTKKNDPNNDLIYDEVDQFHNDDYLRLDHEIDDDDDDDDDSDGMEQTEEAIMELDDGDDDDEEEEDDDVDDEDDEEEISNDDEDEEEVPVSSSDEYDSDDNDDDNVRDWGAKKNTYYYGDTADLEIGQDEDDAKLEELAAKEVLAARYQDMTDDDFMVTDPTQNEDDAVQMDDGNNAGLLIKLSRKNVLQLSSKEKRQLLNQQHAEFIPLVTYFTKIIQSYQTTTYKATDALFYGEDGTADSVGATKLGQQYLLTKSLIQSSAALNLVMYLLLKAEQSDIAAKNKKVIDPALIQSHPVMLHLQKLNSLNSKLEDGVEAQVAGLFDQLETLVKAANLLNSTTNDDEPSEDDEDDDVDEVDNSDSDNGDIDNTDTNGVDGQGTQKNNLHDTMVSSDSDDDDDSFVDEDAARRITLNDARFGLRPNEIQNLQHTKGKQRKQNDIFISDAGDDDIDDVDDEQRKKIGQSLATTLNTIEQRTTTQRKKSKHTSQQLVEHIDEPNDDDNDGELRRGLEMMEQALGEQSDNDDEPGMYDPELDDEYDNGNDDDFYSKVSKKSKAMKDSRKQQYNVAPKYPRIEPDIPGERTASKQIIKNRGLVAHKAKINRNPRVKKREQFRKAKIRMAGAVPQMRSPNEGQNYGGEATGISMNVTRSRKLL